jgi:GNAT superfamily N-acetyltransferase
MSETTIPPITIRRALPEDAAEWRAMWEDYCAFNRVAVADEVTRGTWARILETEGAVRGVIAVDEGGARLGFAHYVLHPHTWSLRQLCYLEDLFVRPQARGQRVGRRLIEHLVLLGQKEGWGRVYWHTETSNATARRLYDRFRLADPLVRYTIPL